MTTPTVTCSNDHNGHERDVLADVDVVSSSAIHGRQVTNVVFDAHGPIGLITPTLDGLGFVGGSILTDFPATRYPSRADALSAILSTL